MDIVMCIVWSVVIAVALVAELVTMGLVSIWFIPAGIVSLLLSIFAPESLVWQLSAFIVLSVLGVIFLKPLLQKLIPNKTTPTNADANVGHIAKIEIINAQPAIKIGDVVWRVSCNAALENGDTVEIKGTQGNKMLVEKR